MLELYTMAQLLVKAMLIDAVVASISHAIRCKAIQPAAIPVVQMGVSLLRREKLPGAEKKALLIQAIERIASGADGIAGTRDDLIPPIVVMGLRALIESQVIDGLIDMAHTAIKNAKTPGFFSKWCCF